MENILELLNSEKEIIENFEEVDDINNIEIGQENIIFTDSEKNVDILTEMFDDSLIKTDDSPFKNYPDDKQEFVGSPSYVDLGKAIQQYRNGEIDDRMLRILEIIVHHRYINTRQIWQMYLLKYSMFIKRESLKKILNRMVDKGLITEFVIKSSIGVTNYRIFCADYNGVRLYTALKSENVNWKRTDVLQKTHIIKRSLAKNQFLISYLKHYDFEYSLQKKITWISDVGREEAIRPAMELTFKSHEQIDSVVFLVDVIRVHKDWEEEFSEKLLRYGSYLKSVEDTQALKKYYIIICAESPEQIKEASKLYYNLRHIRKMQEISRLKLFYTHDLELLDGRYNGTLIDSLRSIEYNYEKREWEECRLNFDIETKDWRSIKFEKEILQNEPIQKSLGEEKTENINIDKKELSEQIYKVVKEKGCKFPIPAVKISTWLFTAGINYKNLGYKRLKNLFLDLSDYYEISYFNEIEMIIDCVDESIFNPYELKETNNRLNKNNLMADRNIIIDYFSVSTDMIKQYKKHFTNDIYCYINLEKTISLLNKLTNITDFSKNGWLNILSYCYHIAMDEGRVFYNSTNTYLYFDTGILSKNKEPIYLLAKTNYRNHPEWVLSGIKTLSDDNLFSDILETEFVLKT